MFNRLKIRSIKSPEHFSIKSFCVYNRQRRINIKLSSEVLTSFHSMRKHTLCSMAGVSTCLQRKGTRPIFNSVGYSVMNQPLYKSKKTCKPCVSSIPGGPEDSKECKETSRDSKSLWKSQKPPSDSGKILSAPLFRPPMRGRG